MKKGQAVNEQKVKMQYKSINFNLIRDSWVSWPALKISNLGDQFVKCRIISKNAVYS